MTEQPDEPPFDLDRPPVRGMSGDHPIPDLARIPKEHWVTVLRRAHPRVVHWAAAGVIDDHYTDATQAIGKALLLGPDRPKVPTQTVAYPDGLPTGRVSVPRRRERRQVNFRLAPPEYEELERAAKLLSMRPSAAARLLTVRGVQQVLREAER